MIDFQLKIKSYLHGKFVDMEDIDSLIFGNFATEIIDMEIPLWAPCEYMKRDALDGAYALFNGFLVFLMYKLGYKVKLVNPQPDFEINFEDNSWWVNNLGDLILNGWVGFQSWIYGLKVPPYVFREFENDKGEEIVICILLDWFSFYECGLILNKLTIDEKSNYDSQKILDEFVIRSDKENFLKVLNYLKDLENPAFASSHKLVLRSDRLAEYVVALNEDYLYFHDFPENVFKKEDWDKMEFSEHVSAYAKTELIFCEESNFKKLLKKSDIQIPNIDFISFNEFIKNKINSIDEWIDIRDRYISKLKTELKEPYLSKEFLQAIRFLQKARNSLERKSYSESIMFSANAIEDALNEYLENSELELHEKINALKENKDMSKHVTELHYIRKKRNDIVHPNNFEVDENTARKILEMADEFLADFKKSI